MPQADTKIRYISGGRELRKFLRCPYWFIQLTPSEREDWPGVHWTGWVLFHKWKLWERYGEYFNREEGIYHYLDGNPDNIRVTNIGVFQTGTQECIL